MPFKTILAVMGAGDNGADIDNAIALATERDAHLSIIVLGIALSPLVGDYSVTTAWIDERQKEINDLLRIQKKVEERCSADGLSFDAENDYDDLFFLEKKAAIRGMYADLILMGSDIRLNPDLRKATIAAGLFDAGTPVLISPSGTRASLKPKRVLIAWNSRPEAANAAKASLDILKDAQEVHLAIVDPDAGFYNNGGQPGAEAAAFLARHGVKVEVDQLASAGRPVEDVLRQHVLELGCDMMVMGGYGHSRLRERIFGGVTASVLQDFKIPVFLAR